MTICDAEKVNVDRHLDLPKPDSDLSFPTAIRPGRNQFVAAGLVVMGLVVAGIAITPIASRPLTPCLRS